jgi:ribosomal protein S27E
MSDLQVQFITLTVACANCGHKQKTSGYAGTTWDFTCAGCGGDNEVTQPQLTALVMERIRRGEVPWATA